MKSARWVICSTLAAFDAAADDLRPKIEEAMRELPADPRLGATSAFVEANAARVEAGRAESTS